MTTPDHHPYLTTTDLRTPEDVLAWLDAEAASWTEAGIEHGTEPVRFDVAVSQTLATAAKYVRDRLDRERRQACRRAALAEWRRISGLLRGKGLPFLVPGDEVPASIGILPFLTVGSHSPDGACWGSANEVYGWVYGAISKALAFRAAARTP